MKACTTDLKVNSFNHLKILHCDKTNDHVCFFLAAWENSSTITKISKINFQDPTSINHTDPDTYNRVKSVAVVNEHEFIASGFEQSYPDYYLWIYSANQSSTTLKWQFKTEVFEDIYSSRTYQKIFTHVDNPGTKYIALLPEYTSVSIVVLDPADGTKIGVKKYRPDESISGSRYTFTSMG